MTQMMQIYTDLLCENPHNLRHLRSIHRTPTRYFLLWRIFQTAAGLLILDFDFRSGDGTVGVGRAFDFGALANGSRPVALIDISTAGYMNRAPIDHPVPNQAAARQALDRPLELRS